MGGMMAPDGKGGYRDRPGYSLSVALVTAATDLAIRDKNPQSKVVRKKLEEPISMSFNAETPLDDVVKYIKQATTTPKYSGIPIYVDPDGLEQADSPPPYAVKNIELDGIPLKTTLRLLLRQLGLAYCVRDGVLIISSPEGIARELREAQEELDTLEELAEEPSDEAPKSGEQPAAPATPAACG